MKFKQFSTKIFITLILCLTLPVIITSSFLFQREKEILKEESKATLQESLFSSAATIDTKLSAIKTISSTLQYTLNRTLAVSSVPQDDKERRLYYLDLLDKMEASAKLLQFTYSTPDFENYYLYLEENKDLLVSQISYFEDIENIKLPFLENASYTFKISVPYDLLLSSIVGSTMERRSITYNLPIMNSEGSNKNMLVACLPENYLCRMLESYLKSSKSMGVIMDGNGTILSSTSKDLLGTSSAFYQKVYTGIMDDRLNDYFEIEYEGKTFCINLYRSDISNWYYISSIDEAILTSSVNSLKKSVFTIVGILALVAVLMTVAIVKYLSRPLNTLQSAMQFVKDKDFDYQITEKRSDEFGEVYTGFNSMVTEMNNQIQNLTTEKILRRDAKIMLLQSQINPHMLYNTLEAIYSMAKIEGSKEIATLVMALSKFFRVSLSEGKQYVILDEAVDLASQYLTIQNIRYNYKIKVSFDISPKLSHQQVPKFLLQPIIENSIKHGFKNQNDSCEIATKAYADNGTMYITVIDNGCGISPKDLSSIRSRIQNFDFEEKSYKSYALRNINCQIKLRYGTQYGLQIDSQQHVYTNIMLTLPFSQDKEDS